MLEPALKKKKKEKNKIVRINNNSFVFKGEQQERVCGYKDVRARTLTFGTP